MLSTKEELYLYLEKISRGYALKDLKYFTANHISESLNISRNLASQYLNELVKEERAIKVNSRPVYFFHKKNVEREAQVALCSFSRKMQNIFASFAKTYFKNRKRTF